MSTGMIIAVVVAIVLVVDVFLFLFLRKIKLQARVVLEGALAPTTRGDTAHATAETHTFNLPRDTMQRAKEMKAQGASIDDICRAVDAGYDARSPHEQHALHTMIDMMLGGVGNSITGTFKLLPTAAQDRLPLSKDALERAKALFADGSPPDDICRDVHPEYRDWDPKRQENFRAVLEALLKSRMV